MPEPRTIPVTVPPLVASPGLAAPWIAARAQVIARETAEKAGCFESLRQALGPATERAIQEWYALLVDLATENARPLPDFHAAPCPVCPGGPTSCATCRPEQDWHGH
jgi:hypothetical protein